MARIKFTGPGAKKPEIPKEPEVPRSSKSAKYPKKPKTTMTALRRSLRNTSVSDAGVAEKASVAAATGPVADTDVVMAEAAVADKGTGKGKTGGKGTISAASYTRMTAGAGVFTGADEDYSDDEEAPAAIAAAEAITSVEEGGSAEAAAGTATATAAAEATVAGVPDAIAAEGDSAETVEEAHGASAAVDATESGSVDAFMVDQEGDSAESDEGTATATATGEEAGSATETTADEDIDEDSDDWAPTVAVIVDPNGGDPSKLPPKPKNWGVETLAAYLNTDRQGTYIIAEAISQLRDLGGQQLNFRTNEGEQKLRQYILDHLDELPEVVRDADRIPHRINTLVSFFLRCKGEKWNFLRITSSQSPHRVARKKRQNDLNTAKKETADEAKRNGQTPEKTPKPQAGPQTRKRKRDENEDGDANDSNGVEGVGTQTEAAVEGRKARMVDKDTNTGVELVMGPEPVFRAADSAPRAVFQAPQCVAISNVRGAREPPAAGVAAGSVTEGENSRASTSSSPSSSSTATASTSTPATSTACSISPQSDTSSHSATSGTMPPTRLVRFDFTMTCNRLMDNMNSVVMQNLEKVTPFVQKHVGDFIAPPELFDSSIVIMDEVHNKTVVLGPVSKLIATSTAEAKLEAIELETLLDLLRQKCAFDLAKHRLDYRFRPNDVGNLQGMIVSLGISSPTQLQLALCVNCNAGLGDPVLFMTAI